MRQGTRGDFFQSINEINDEEYPKLMTCFFEQFSILYNIIGGYTDLNVYKTSGQFSFNINTPSPEIATEIFNKISGDAIQVYGRVYSISASMISPTVLNIQIK